MLAAQLLLCLPWSAIAMTTQLDEQILILEDQASFPVASATAISSAPRPPQVLFRVGMTLEEVEREMLFTTLAYYDNHKPKAAQALGISLKTVYNRLAKFGSGDSSALYGSNQFVSEQIAESRAA
jgi:DNA-binding NtrC family response regulator